MIDHNYLSKSHYEMIELTFVYFTVICIVLTCQNIHMMSTILLSKYYLFPRTLRRVLSFRCTKATPFKGSFGRCPQKNVGFRDEWGPPSNLFYYNSIHFVTEEDMLKSKSK